MSIGSIAIPQLRLTCIRRFVHQIWKLQAEGDDDHLPLIIAKHLTEELDPSYAFVASSTPVP